MRTVANHDQLGEITSLMSTPVSGQPMPTSIHVQQQRLCTSASSSEPKSVGSVSGFVNGSSHVPCRSSSALARRAFALPCGVCFFASPRARSCSAAAAAAWPAVAFFFCLRPMVSSSWSTVYSEI